MTNAQFYTAIAVPSVLVMISWILVALSWMQQDKRLARIEVGIDNLGKDLRSEMKDMRSEIRSEMKDIRSEMITLRDGIHRYMVPLRERMATLEAKQG